MAPTCPSFQNPDLICPVSHAFLPRCVQNQHFTTYVSRAPTAHQVNNVGEIAQFESISAEASLCAGLALRSSDMVSDKKGLDKECCAPMVPPWPRNIAAMRHVLLTTLLQQ